jgi:predicted phage tail component-like protein
MAKSITYNSYDFQTSKWRTQDIIYRNLPEKNIDVQPKARGDGFDVVNTYYSQKVITIEGVVTDDTEANLKTTLDEMKDALNTNEANLDIGDGSGTMRFIASVESISIPEEHYNITSLPYRISFLCQPFGKSTTVTTDTKSITNASASPYTNTITITGSASPKPVLKWLCSGAPTSAITQIVFTNTTTGETITVPSLALDANNDYLEIDCDAMTVKVSHDGGAATAIDFSGLIPTFLAGNNAYSVTKTGGGATFTLTQTIIYYSLYL